MASLQVCLLRCGAIIALGLLCRAGAAAAAAISVNGLEFSDELGGFRIHAVSGRGTKDDPFVVVEDITGEIPAVMVVRGLDVLYADDARRGSPRSVAGFYLRKVVTNRTGRVWHRFDLELREQPNKASHYFDGLSFDQAGAAERPFKSDRFAAAEEIMEPMDTVRFTGGSVGPGETVTLNVVISDPTPRPEFYLLQYPTTPMTKAPGGLGERLSEVLPRRPGAIGSVYGKARLNLFVRYRPGATISRGEDWKS